MKHLKSKEEYLHGGSYTRIDDETFIFDKESLRSKREPLDTSELKWFVDKELIKPTNDTDVLGLSIIKWNYGLKIWKYQDEWYYVICGRASETTNSDMEFRKYFKCDGFDGLQSLVELWISRRGNLKSRDIK